MKETIKGWVARDRLLTEKTRAIFHTEKPHKSERASRQVLFQPTFMDRTFYIGKCFSLKPGECKRATLTIQVDND